MRASVGLSLPSVFRELVAQCEGLEEFVLHLRAFAQLAHTWCCSFQCDTRLLLTFFFFFVMWLMFEGANP